VTYWLSLDWDFFCREDPAWDWGHSESRSDALANIVWSIRASQFLAQGLHPKKETRIGPYPGSFLNRLAKKYDFTPCRFLDVAESHVHAYHSFSGVKGGTILHFDAHHDLAYNEWDDILDLDTQGDRLDCANWLALLLLNRPDMKAIVVYPPWKGLREVNATKFMLPKSILDRVEFLVYPKLPPPGKVWGAFACRSGSWAPPWHDGAFKRLLDGLERVSDLLVQYREVVPERKLNWRNIRQVAAIEKTALQRMSNMAEKSPVESPLTPTPNPVGWCIATPTEWSKSRESSA
jgi:hypothetical protein